MKKILFSYFYQQSFKSTLTISSKSLLLEENTNFIYKYGSANVNMFYKI